jgi:hypothetical protein
LHRRVGVHDVETAERLGGGVDGGADPVGIGHVSRDDDAPAAERRDLVGEGVERRPVETDGGDVGAFARGAHGRRPTDPAPGAGDQDATIRQSERDVRARLDAART